MADTTPITKIDTQENMETKIFNILSDTYPNLDCGPGTPVYEMVIRPTALLWSRQANGIEELARSINMNNYLTMSEDDLDRLLSRYFISRRSGNYTTGVVRLVFGTRQDVYIAAGEIWELDEVRNYEVISDHFVVAAELPGNEAEGYYLDVPVQSIGTGDTYNAYTNEAVKCTGDSSQNARRAYFLTDTSDGGLAESNYVFYNRAKDELAARGLYSYKTVKAMLRDNFPTINEVVPVGIRDAEMTRDLVNIRGYGTVHIGGKCDIYVHPNQYKVVTGYQPPMGFPMKFNGFTLADEPYKLMQAWNDAQLLPEDIGLRGSSKEAIPLLTPASPVSTLTTDLVDFDNFIQGTENALLHTDNLVKQMWPIVVTMNIQISDVDAYTAIVTAKLVLTEYIKSLRSTDAPQVAEISHILRSAGISQIHTPIDMKAWYLTEDLRIECIGLDSYRSPQTSILVPLQTDSLAFTIEDTSQISMRTCCWYTNEDLINIEVID